ncbi:PhzF family phenazine biosynthesis protein [Dyella solisilvae]|uniref:PhzF family phenazine biosynthesis protein n=1 Tax=Dyella solisilvae TaxID=1920168 RepID=A0A370KDB5_9GAMM|nr:PhzF family phenazine biosynthesis protein [Dyella solisilvae]RDJ00644.1 PhzF family phenazine biosynthesis protein [Dyella solisilvae]
MSIRYLHLDVFAATPGGGNHLGVVTDATGWSDARMQDFARWTNLVETTFLLPPTQPNASYRVRIFTPHKEIPFAGHPSIGSAHAVLLRGLAAPVDGVLWQECGAGVLPIRIEGEGESRRLLLKSPHATVEKTGRDAHPLLHDALAGIALGALPPAYVAGGRHWWLAECADEESLRQWQPDHSAIGALAHATNSLGLCVFARSAHPDYQLVVRAFPSGVGIIEDPASGAANGLIAAYIAHAEPHGPLARGYTVSQGREIGHDASLSVRIDGSTVWIGGHTNTIIDGALHWNGAA